VTSPKDTLIKMQALQRSTMPASTSRPVVRGQRTVVSPAQRAPTPAQQHVPLAGPCPSRMDSMQQGRRGGVACQGLFGLGLPEIAVIAGIAALVFGPGKLPELGKGLGKTVKSFQTAAKEFETELKVAAAGGESETTPGATVKTTELKDPTPVGTTTVESPPKKE